MVEYGAFNLKIDYDAILNDIPNPEGHPICITGSRVMWILINR